MKHIKQFVLTLALLFALIAPITAQQLYTKDANGNFVPVLAMDTNGAPFLSGPAMDLLATLGSATNWGVAGFGIYEPASSGHRAAYGAGAVALYNINLYMASGIGIDWLDNAVTMPSGQFQFQFPFILGGTNGIKATPFAFTGVATPVSGMGADNGTAVGLFGEIG